ncbi:hypothetical protein BT93_F1309 [Corymbia citriodora subsp. variegata]|nr:hypothetical protein BT93_F1309 [Corymbia citriodora subsp. variegata]
MVALKVNTRQLSARKADIISKLNQEGRRPGKRTKEEVGVWIQNVGDLEVEVDELGRVVEQGHFLSLLMSQHRVTDCDIQVEKLFEKGKFDGSLTMDVTPARGYELQPGELVGQDSQTKRDEIWDCLMNEEVLRVGVWGQAGVGKTFLAKHIHDQIVRECTRFDGACLVNVSQEGTVGTIQNDIAKYLDPNGCLTDVSAVYWGARLREALQGRRLLIILDDVRISYSLEEVGIALERNGCKLIVTSRSREVCEQMNCRELVHVATAPE